MSVLESTLLKGLESRFIRKILSLSFPEKVFQNVHAWPGESLPWAGQKVALGLSFDCDIPEDARALPALLALLKQYEMHVPFAVVGQLVEEAPELYSAIVEAGHEIINHGYTQHTRPDGQGGYVPIHFYHELSEEQIEAEITHNHECLQAVLGVQPVGFRTPHFGTFQRPEQIALLHRLLARHGYRYSSSATMFQAKRFGYLQPGQPVQEFPLATMVGAPFLVFDSWGTLKAPGRVWKDEDFFPQFQRMIDTALASPRPAFVNVYLDPSHVAHFEGFERCLAYIEAVRDRVWFGRYVDILG